MRTRCSSATSATGVTTSTALDSKRSPAVDTAFYTTYYLPMHILETTSFVRSLALFGVQLLSKLWMQDASGRRQCCPGQVGTRQFVHSLSFYLNLYLDLGQVDTRQFVHKFISLCFSRDEKAEWVYETKTNMKGEKIYSHTMCLPCHK